ncbi:MAG: DNA mismatch repair endonuclease MutL, partial [Clostridia bacterium]|nr:DNA mismatch repair endonuclease MutL [Clostridia bacterium]
MIKVLPKDVAARIAAGEVVDRPLSVVKELVENAIDAGSESITVEIKKGGKTYIRVTDDGSGIRDEDVLTAFKRHATSKIETDEDLKSIETLGFRGEALASIAAVSNIRMITKTEDEAVGNQVIMRGGELVENTKTGCPKGTTIVISDLFFNTPARQKFMKTDGAESSLITDFVSQTTMAYPNIKIRYINNDSILFATNGKGDIYTNLVTVFGASIAVDLVPVNHEESGIAVKGYVSGLGNGRTNKKNQVFFVNGRVVSSKVISKAVSDSYTMKLTGGRYPVSFLFIKLSPKELDVNIHPNKRDVRFSDERAVQTAIVNAISKALVSKESLPKIHELDVKNPWKFHIVKHNDEKQEEIAPETERTSDSTVYDAGIELRIKSMKESVIRSALEAGLLDEAEAEEELSKNLRTRNLKKKADNIISMLSKERKRERERSGSPVEPEDLFCTDFQNPGGESTSSEDICVREASEIHYSAGSGAANESAAERTAESADSDAGEGTGNVTKAAVGKPAEITNETACRAENSKQKHASGYDWESLKVRGITPFDFKKLNIRGIIFNTYIMATDGDSFY